MDNQARFEEFVARELGDIAVEDNGRYISPKIQNYWKTWQAAQAKDALFDVAMSTLRQIASTPRNRKARVNASAAIHFIETQAASAKGGAMGSDGS